VTPAAPGPAAGEGPVLVTGGAGFIGCNLADRLAAEGHDVLVFDSLARPGVAENLHWLRRRNPRRVSAVMGDVRDAAAVTEAVRDCRAVFHFAAQVAVTTSLHAPIEDFSVNVQGTLRLLDALRLRPRGPVPLLYASTNKVYGDLADVALEVADNRWQPRDANLRARGVSETRPIAFHTPYGCSKGAADQYVLDWARSYGVPTSVMRMSCIYGTHQRGTEDQGWVAHFLLRALAGAPITIFGDGQQVRDILFVDDAVAAYLAAWRGIGRITGRAFNLGGGPVNAVSLRDVLDHAGRLLGRPIEVSHAPWRPGDQRWYVSDTHGVRNALDLPPPLPWRVGMGRLLAWLRRDHTEAPLETAA
jgi:CDP-paratose 2-epimerase